MTAASEVIVPTYTFAASAEVVLYLGARPVLVDVDEDTLGVDPAAVEARSAHGRGRWRWSTSPGCRRTCPASSSRRRGSGSPVVEDVAHAFPSPITALGGRFAGTVGRAGAFSFYATKTITTGEGGMLVTDDDAIADRARTMRLHGIGRDAWKRYTAAGSWYYEIEARASRTT